MTDDCPASPEETRKFIDGAYWVLGSLCFIWETAVVIGATRNKPINLPLLGECTQGEALIITLTFFWPALVALHWLAHAHQAHWAPAAPKDPQPPQSKGGWRERLSAFCAAFPGALGDLRVPARLASVRFWLFLCLLVWPTVAHVFSALRTYDQMMILGTHAPTAGSHEAEVVRKKSELLTWSELPMGKNGHPLDWRWLHWRDDAKLKDPKKPELGYQREAVALVSALRFQPWFFAASSFCLAFSTVWLLGNALGKLSRRSDRASKAEKGREATSAKCTQTP